MTVVLDKITARQDRFIERLTTLQKPVVSVVGRTSNLVAERAPRAARVPLPQGLGSVATLVDAQFRFAARLVEANRSFALQLVDAVGIDGAPEAAKTAAAAEAEAEAAPKAKATRAPRKRPATS